MGLSTKGPLLDCPRNSFLFYWAPSHTQLSMGLQCMYHQLPNIPRDHWCPSHPTVPHGMGRTAHEISVHVPSSTKHPMKLYHPTVPHGMGRTVHGTSVHVPLHTQHLMRRSNSTVPYGMSRTVHGIPCICRCTIPLFQMDWVGLSMDFCECTR